MQDLGKKFFVHFCIKSLRNTNPIIPCFQHLGMETGIAVKLVKMKKNSAIMQNVKFMITKVFDFIQTDIWKIRSKNLSPIKSFFIRQARIVLLTIRSFEKDSCYLRASALTFFSFLSIVPFLAMTFGIAKGFGLEAILEKQLLEKFQGQEEILIYIVNFAHSLLENTEGSLIGGIGVVVLFWTIIKVLGHIEQSLNHIWKIKKTRSHWRKFSDYLSMIIIFTIVMMMSSSITVFIRTEVTFITEKARLIKILSPAIFFVLKFLPHCLIWALFTFTYFLVPNTEVSFRSAIIAGFVAGIFYHIIQWGYIDFQVNVAKYNAIYGSFAALPLFLIWLQLSWIMVLLGAEISFAHQNIDSYEFEQDCPNISFFFMKLLSLQIAHLLIKKFSKGEKPLTAIQISNDLEIPIRIVRRILGKCVESRLFSVTYTKPDIKYNEPSYQPACDINIITTQYVIEALEQNGVDNIPVGQTPELKILSETLQIFKDIIEKSPANRLLRDI